MRYEDVKINIRNSEEAEWLYMSKKHHTALKRKHYMVELPQTDYDKGDNENDCYSIQQRR